MTKDDIKKRLEKHFPNSMIQVNNITFESNHFGILIISEKFNNLSLINRHQLVYSIFSDEITKEIHALQINTFTQSEWNEENK